MDLNEFVAEALTQILAGVRKAQSADDGDLVAAETAAVPEGKNFYDAGSYGTFTIVDFDIGVVATTAGKGGAGIKVLGVGAEAGVEHSNSRENRVKFSVPIRLPQGDTSLGDKGRQADADAIQAYEAPTAV